MPMSRRGFLKGRFRTAAAALRPPWALAPEAFEDRCDRCRACITACPAGIVVAGAGGFPTLDFSSGECTFCGDCVRACRAGALMRADDDAAPWTLKAVVAEGCLAAQGVECRVCGEACGAGAIRFRPRVGGASLPLLDAAACTGCGACEAPCPVAAIRMTNEMEITQ